MRATAFNERRKGTQLILSIVFLLAGILVSAPVSRANPKEEKKGSEPEPKETFTNSLGMIFVSVPGTDVYFCIHTTRRKDYAVYASETPEADMSWQDQTFYNKPVADGANHPVVGVNWEEAKAFCAWLSKKEGRVYRLPTDREWSVAAGLGSLEKVRKRNTPAVLSGEVPHVWAWGAEWPPPKGTGNFADTVCGLEYPNLLTIPDYTDGYATTAPVMSFAPNLYGLYDMGGNVLQWCEDRFDSEKPDRVERGGHYGLGDANGGALLVSARGHHPPRVRTPYTGFRIVLEEGVR